MPNRHHARPADTNRLRQARQARVTWRRTADAEHPYNAWIGGSRWVLRLGDFPAEPLYTLLVDGEEIGSLDTWPATWTRPNS